MPSHGIFSPFFTAGAFPLLHLLVSHVLEMDSVGEEKGKKRKKVEVGAVKRAVDHSSQSSVYDHILQR